MQGTAVTDAYKQGIGVGGSPKAAAPGDVEGSRRVVARRDIRCVGVVESDNDHNNVEDHGVRKAWSGTRGSRSEQDTQRTFRRSRRRERAE